jgi:NTP pyrophosphatase (non-canonical NTP hydrolase)
MYLQEEIEAWASAKGIYNYGSFNAQMKVLAEEVIEATEAYCYHKIERTQQARVQLEQELGDIYVVWINACKVANMDPEDCARKAVMKNAARTGNMVNGRFVKDTVDD